MTTNFGKTAILILVMLFGTVSLFGQSISGQWNGILQVQGLKLKLVFNISEKDGGLETTMDSPDQGTTGIKVNKTIFENSILKLEIPAAKFEYIGELKNGVIKGKYLQAGQSFPLDLVRGELSNNLTKKPQEPTPPYPYLWEEITFQNPLEKLTLAGTLTLPKKDGKVPAVILISGFGPQNRDGEVFGHKPFLVIADYLTKKGFAVLRFDDRGTGKSAGNFEFANTEHFATDVESGIAYLKTRKEVDGNKIGLIGHSEGGVVASIVAARNSDVKFTVLLASAGLSGDKVLLRQTEMLGKASNVNPKLLENSLKVKKWAFELVKNSTNGIELVQDLYDYYDVALKATEILEKPKELKTEDFLKIAVKELTNPSLMFLLKFNPAETLQKIKSPVLALNGDKDLQVAAVENLSAIKTALHKGGNKNVTVTKLPNLNHLFQQATTGSPNEYAVIEQTFSPEVLNLIGEWLAKRADLYQIEPGERK